MTNCHTACEQGANGPISHVENCPKYRPVERHCLCPGDCNCRHQGALWYRFNYCGPKAHPAERADNVYRELKAFSRRPEESVNLLEP
jgi:hypothetical protein